MRQFVSITNIFISLLLWRMKGNIPSSGILLVIFPLLLVSIFLGDCFFMFYKHFFLWGYLFISGVCYFFTYYEYYLYVSHIGCKCFSSVIHLCFDFLYPSIQIYSKLFYALWILMSNKKSFPLADLGNTFCYSFPVTFTFFFLPFTFFYTEI